MPLDLGSVEMYMGPPELGAPDDLEATIIQFIDQAQNRLAIAIQELQSRPIAEALVRARARGVIVRLILEGNYLTLRESLMDPWIPGGENEPNREIFAALLRARIAVIFDLNPATFHQKYVIRDPNGSRAAVLTGSTNFTPTGCHKNLNHLLILRGRKVATTYLEEFEETWTGTFGAVRGRFDPKPRYIRLAKICLKVLFAPDHTPELEIMKQMLKATRRVDFAMFTFAQSSGIDDAMIALSRAGIPVRGVLDRRQGNQRWAATRPVAGAGAQLFWPRVGQGIGKLHHKLAVIDEQIVVAGSFNYSGPANAMNDENIIVIGDMEEDDHEASERQRSLAGYAMQEIDRIILEFGEAIPLN